MPIKHLRDRRRYIRLGKIRLGVQVEVLTETGKVKMRNNQPVMRPQATDYFVIKEEVEGLRQEVIDKFGEQPREIDVRFIFEEEDETFPQYLKMYRGDGQLRCMGDGERVISRRYFDKDKEIDVRLISGGSFMRGHTVLEGGLDMDALWNTWAEQYGWGEWHGDAKNSHIIPCLGEQCPQYGPRACRPTGRLLFMIEGIDRLGFWELVVHQYAIVGINSQMELARAFNAQYLGRPTILHTPFKLRLTGPQTFKINGFSAKVYTPELEPDPQHVTDVVAGAIELPPLPLALSAASQVDEIYRRRGGMRQVIEDMERGLQPAQVVIDPAEEEQLDYIPTPEEDMWPDGVEEYDQEKLPV